MLADKTAQDFAVVELHDEWLDLPQVEREQTVTAVAVQLIQSELSKQKVNTAMIPIKPIFGHNTYPVQEKLVFTLMPFTNDLTAIYSSIIKPVVEAKGLVSRRADDISSNNAIMQDIWRTICEARFIIADITGRNPNVMYEIGIAHTIGKEVILIHQRGDDAALPFDIAHVRIIIYDNTAIGGGLLKTKIESTIDSVLQKLTVASLMS